MLKIRIKSLDEVPAEMREHYDEADDGFELQTDGAGAFAALNFERAESRKKSERNQKLAARIVELEDELGRRQAGTAKPPAAETPRDRFLREQAKRLDRFAPDTPEYQAEIEAILEMPEARAFMDAEIAGREVELNQELTDMRTTVERETVRSAAARIALTMAKPGSSLVLEPHLADRLATKWDGNACAVIFKGTDGAEISEAALTEEFRTMRPEFAAVIEGASEADKAAHARRVAETLGTTKAGALKYTRAQFDALAPGERASARESGAVVGDH